MVRGVSVLPKCCLQHNSVCKLSIVGCQICECLWWEGILSQIKLGVNRSLRLFQINIEVTKDYGLPSSGNENSSPSSSSRKGV